MYDKEFKEIYESISPIYKNSVDSFKYHSIGNNITEKVKVIEDIVKSEQEIKYIMHRWDIDYYSIKKLNEKLCTKTNYTREESINIIMDRLNNRKTFYNIIQEFDLEDN